MLWLIAPVFGAVSTFITIHFHEKAEAKRRGNPVRRPALGKTEAAPGTRRAEVSLSKPIKPGLTGQLSRRVTALEEPYQRFVQERFAHMLGPLRQQHSEQIGGSLEISAKDRDQNRRIGLSLLLSGAAGASALYPPLLIVTLPFYIGMLAPVYAAAFHDLTRKKRISFWVLWAGFGTGILVTGNYVAGSLAMAANAVLRKVEGATEEQARQQISDVFGLQRPMVCKWSDGAGNDVPFEEIKAGDSVMVHAGQALPVDGRVLDGMGLVDQHRLTGESQPVTREAGDSVFATTVLLSGRLLVEVKKAGNETQAAEIVRILQQTTGHHLQIEAKGVRLAERTMAPALALAVLLWPFVGGETAVALVGAAMPGVDVMFAAPLTLLNFLNFAAARQILVKDGRSLELLQKVNHIVFDKTGTLTLEQPHVAGIHVCGDFSEEDILRYAAAAEVHQSHPIARAILTAAADRHLEIPDAQDATYEVGYGIQVQLAAGASGPEHLVGAGSDRFMELAGIPIPERFSIIRTGCDHAGHSLVFVAIDGQLAGGIELSPTIRPEAKRVVAELARRGLSVSIISGDQEGPTRRLAEKLNIREFYANVLPLGKAELIRDLQARGRSVCFVGDGINDAIALKQAHVSISLRGATTVATDTAQIVLMDQSLEKLPVLLDTARDLDRNLHNSFLLSAGGGYALMASVIFLHIRVAGALFYGYLIAAGVFTNTMFPAVRRRIEASSEKNKLELEPPGR